jgi:tetratricopeptide (TPR) repeat protein
MTGGDPAERLALGETAVRLSRAHDLPEQLAYALLDVWYGYAGLGRWDESLASLAEARERWRALGNLAMQCEAESRIALTHMIAGDFRAGLAAVAQSYQTARAANSPHMQGLSRVFAGRMYLEQGRLAQSIEVMHDVIALGEATGNVTALIGTRADLAQAYGLLGEVETALALTGQALAAGVGRVDLLVPWPRGIAARLHVQQGALAAAEAQLAGLDHQRLRRQSGFMPSLWVNVGLAVVELALARGEPDPAAALARQLLADLHAWRITYVVPEVQGVLGQALLAAGRLVEARAALQSARMTALAIGARRQLWPILAALAQVEEASGLTGAAGQLRAEARALIEDIAAHAPPTLRASFLAQPAIQALLPPASADPSKDRS